MKIKINKAIFKQQQNQVMTRKTKPARDPPRNASQVPKNGCPGSGIYVKELEASLRLIAGPNPEGLVSAISKSLELRHLPPLTQQEIDDLMGLYEDTG